VLGTALCLLAAAFALEAKLGGYSPNGNVRVQFSSIKVQPADATRHAAQTLFAPVSHSPKGHPQLLAIAADLPVFIILRLADITPTSARIPFSPPHFYRPPPAFIS